MRKKYYILWLDDEFDNDNPTLDNLVESVENYIKSLFFEPEIIKMASIQESLAFCENLQNKKIDLFISDYNIDEGMNGLDFLHKIRKKYLQDLILYSANEKNVIKSKMIKYLNDEHDINFFSRFSFESLVEPEELKNKIFKIIDINMQKWNELNGLRGLVLSEISLFETKIKKKMTSFDKQKMKQICDQNSVDYSKPRYRCLKKFLDGDDLQLEYISFGLLKLLILLNTDQLFAVYENVADIRNSMAHVEESYENGEPVIISINDSTRIYREKDIKLYRRLLFSFLDDINNYINNF